MKRILVVDDHSMVGTALQFLLRALDSSIDTMFVVTIAEAHAQLCLPPKFDLVLLDYAMPDTDGLRGLDALKTGYPDLPIAIISGSSDSRIVRNALEMGAIGWVPKTLTGAPLLHALRLMANGQRFCPPEFLMNTEATEPFSTREGEVAKLLARGLTDKEIANQLAIEPGTVKVHVKKLLRKSGAENRTKFALMQQALG